ncbi:hypothetical protein HHL16_23720 [Pseudoflavitalea sp. G-6-1-2]|uniref:SRPBCC family protein n=1 Tax=Pseudoflavitalea sp. G-6-1-2 TaxID=2728841 RepID=UPI00146D1FCD|nr:SRPBCC family protein [Pseudoflavitalea sp. G-6-1-2]NML23910.1 hypothetical protein [Pseudoflavitalea sp. G-6-1-2]
MKKIKLIAGLLMAACGTATAQMGEAQKITFDKDTTVNFNVSVDAVWKLVKDPAKWNELSNGHISSISTKGSLETALLRTISFADGTTRTDEVSQFMPEYKFIVNRVVAPLPKGVTENIYMFSLVNEEGKGTQMKYSIKVDGSEPGKQQLLAALIKEMDAFLRGVQQALNK